MRTHIQRAELEAMGVCPEYQGDSIPDAWGDRTAITLEDFLTEPINDGTPTPPKDALWCLVNLMSRSERLQLGLDIITGVESETPDNTVRESLVVMTSFLSGSSSDDAVSNQRVIVEALLHETQQGSPYYQMVDSSRQLLNPSASQKSVMRICRFVDGHTSDATYDNFNQLAILILKG